MQSKRIFESGMTFNRYAFGQQHCACRVKYRVIGVGNGIVRKVLAAEKIRPKMAVVVLGLS